MFRVIVNAIGVSSVIVVLGACGHEVPLNTAAAKEVAAPRSEEAPLAAHSGDSVIEHHSDGGERPPLEIDFLAGAASSAAGSMSATLQLRNNTKTAQDIGYVVQVLDIAGKDVVAPIVAGGGRCVAVRRQHVHTGASLRRGNVRPVLGGLRVHGGGALRSRPVRALGSGRLSVS